MQMEDVEEMINRAVKVATDKLRDEFEKNNAAIVGELAELKEENGHLKVRIRDMERALERNEQYNRKTSLILRGNGIPPPPTDHVEATSETHSGLSQIKKQKEGTGKVPRYGGSGLSLPSQI